MCFYERTINKKNIFNGKIIKLDIHDVLLDNGKTAEREIITHPGGVAVIPITDDGFIYFVKQFRKPYEEEVLEIPAGKLEHGEDPRSCGLRELKEETGLTCEKVTFLTQMYPSPGYTDEKIHIYIAEGLQEGDYARDEDEFLNVCRYTLDEAYEMISTGIIKDAKTIIAVLAVKLKLMQNN
ncbi:MAG: NUDIX hydrolase [Bacillota bacterium]